MASTAARLGWLVERYGIVARVHFSSTKNIAHVDLYCDSKERGLPIVTELLVEGWTHEKNYTNLPDGIWGFSFVHPEITPERHTATRALFEKHGAGPGPNFPWGHYEIHGERTDPPSRRS